MPLKEGHSPAVVHHNIAEMVKSGYPVKRAVAASFSKARESKRKAKHGR